MKLPIKKEYFDQIKSGRKVLEFRDAHITFECIETGEILRKDVFSCRVSTDLKDFYPDVLEDDKTIVFQLSQDKRGK